MALWSVLLPKDLEKDDEAHVVKDDADVVEIERAQEKKGDGVFEVAQQQVDIVVPDGKEREGQQFY